MATWQWSGDVELGPSGQRLVTGTGDPEGVVTAPVGSVYFRVDGGSNHSIYIKEGGSGNTGWTAIGASGTTITLRHNSIANSLQNILDLVSGQGMSIVDLGSGQIQLNGPTFKVGGSTASSQSIHDLRAGTSISILDIGSGRIQITALPQVSIQVNSISAASQSVMNFIQGSNITITDLGAGQIEWSASAASSPGSSTANVTTGSLLPLSGGYDSSNTESGFVNMAKTGLLLKVVVSVPARVRFYKNAALRDADLTRPNSVPPTPGTDHGVLADLYLDSSLTWDLDPVTIITNLDVSRSARIYYNITNIGVSSQTISATMTYVASEG